MVHEKKMSDKKCERCGKENVPSNRSKYCYSCKVDVMWERHKITKKKK